jgi:hypothetical protein
MVGDYNAEEFDTGDGALVRDNAVFLIAALNLKFGFSPEDLTFHKQCVIDNHDCPGRNVVKTDIIARVRAAMATVKSVPPVVSDVVPSPRMLGITATVFGGDGDEQRVAYQDVTPGWPNRADLSKRIDRLEALLGNATSSTDQTTPQDAFQALLQQFQTFLQSVKPTPAVSPAPSPQTDDLVKNIAGLLKQFMDAFSGGQSGNTAPGKLGPVNGALGDAIGNLLNGKKSGIGIIGALLSSVLPTLLPMITSNASILAPISAASGIGLPISLALAAWGVLGKMEKWSGSTGAAAQK